MASTDAFELAKEIERNVTLQYNELVLD